MRSTSRVIHVHRTQIIHVSKNTDIRMGYKAATRPVKQGLVVSCMVPVNQWRRQQSSSLSPYLRVVPTRPSYTQYQQRQCQFVRMGIKLVFIEGLGSSSIRRCTLSAPNPDCSEERLRYAIPHKETALWPLPPCNLTSVMASSRRKRKRSSPFTVLRRRRRRNNPNPPPSRHSHPSLHPRFLLHQHLIHPSTDHFSDYSLDEGVTHSPN